MRTRVQGHAASPQTQAGRGSTPELTGFNLPCRGFQHPLPAVRRHVAWAAGGSVTRGHRKLLWKLWGLPGQLELWASKLWALALSAVWPQTSPLPRWACISSGEGSGSLWMTQVTVKRLGLWLGFGPFIKFQINLTAGFPGGPHGPPELWSTCPRKLATSSL